MRLLNAENMEKRYNEVIEQLSELLHLSKEDAETFYFYGLRAVTLKLNLDENTSVSVEMSKDKPDFNVYDMLVIEDESGSIYQDCVTRISKWKNNVYIIEGDSFVINSDSLEVTDGYMQDRYIIKRDTTIERTYTLKEVWTKVTDGTYKKVWSK